MPLRSLTSLTLVTMLSLPSFSRAETKPEIKPNNASNTQNQDRSAQNNAPNNNHQLPSYLTLNFGYSRNADDFFRKASASGYIYGLLLTASHRKKMNVPEKAGSLEVGGLMVEGTERVELYEIDLSFGLEMYRRRWKQADLICFGEVTSGIQERITKLHTETEIIPSGASIDFLLGGGLKVEGVFHLPRRYTKIPLGLGLGITLEYLSEQIEELPEESNLRKIQVGGYAVVRFAKGR